MNSQTRIIFQEVCGFVYVVAVLVSLEGSMEYPAIGSWANGMLCNVKIDLFGTNYLPSFYQAGQETAVPWRSG